MNAEKGTSTLDFKSKSSINGSLLPSSLSRTRVCRGHSRSNVRLQPRVCRLKGEGSKEQGGWRSSHNNQIEKENDDENNNLPQSAVLSVFGVRFQYSKRKRWPTNQKAWTNIGSVGVIDDADLGRVLFDLHRARLASGIASGTIRYNVTATDGLFIGPSKTLSIRFYKPDMFSVVQARLWSVDVLTGAVTSLMMFDSTPYPAVAGSTQAQTVTFNLPADFDFNAKGYFVEVTLFRLRNASGTLLGDPRIELLKILTQ